MKRFRHILLALFALALVSCESEKALELVNQEAAIDKYITAKYADNTIVRNDGANRVVLTPGSGAELSAGDTVDMQLDGYVFSNGPGTQFLSENVRSVVGKGKLLKGLDSGLIGVQAGEASVILFSAKYGYYDETVGVVPPMSPLLFTVTVNQIVKSAN
ncbi:MAG: FKBP-type peptidyl-prolyl cis-trans isomerase [Bacteroidales bacterium]|nr:FKBP-type peptidyl-prolyl cis-trans isomerase [Bacteroidales bacterium]